MLMVATYCQSSTKPFKAPGPFFIPSFVKLSKNFGFSDLLSHEQTIGRGTPGYMAPEQYVDVSGTSYFGMSVDIFALGVILYNIRTSNTPFGLGHRQLDEAYRLLQDNPDSYWKRRS